LKYHPISFRFNDYGGRPYFDDGYAGGYFDDDDYNERRRHVAF
jgi:hypothetical protein